MNCVFSCFLVDGLLSLGQTSKLLHSFSVYVELKLFFLRRTQLVLIYVKLNLLLYIELNLFLFTSNSTVLCTSNSTFLLYVKLKFSCTSNSICSWYFEFNSVSESAQLCSKTAQLRLQVLSFLPTSFMKSPVSGPSINAYSVKSSVILYSALC